MMPGLTSKSQQLPEGTGLVAQRINKLIRPGR